MPESSPRAPAAREAWRWLVIGAAVVVLAGGFAYVGGFLSPQRLTAQRMVDQLQYDGGLHPGYRRNHAKGICVVGHFDSNGAAAIYSTAGLFAKGSTPVIGRLALPGGDPAAPDSGTPIRSLALLFNMADGQQWRTGMLNVPVFLVSTPESFYAQTVAAAPDPVTHQPDPAKLGAFFAAHPETGPLLTVLKAAKPSASYVTESYFGLNAFYFVDATGQRHPVRWHVAPSTPEDAAIAPSDAGNDYLDADLQRRLAQGPVRWDLLVTLGAPGDPTNDAAKAWPADRTTINAGTVVIESAQPGESGPCRDITYDPTVLPHGIEVSDDPLLAARASAYSNSYRRRTSEEAGIPGSAQVHDKKMEGTR